MGISCRHDGSFEESVVAINAHQGLHDEGHETQVLLGCLTRGMQQNTVVGTQTPVVMLSRTVDAVEGFLMQQHAEPMLPCHLLHQ